MTGSGISGLWGLPPGVDFPRELVRGLLSPRAGLSGVRIARVTLILNSARMRRAVTEAFAAERRATLLPRLRLITDPVSPVARHLAGLVEPVPDLDRRLELFAALRRIADSGALPVPAGGAMAMADSLIGLLQEMAVEGVAPEALRALDPGPHAEHWARTHAILDLLVPYLAATAGTDRAGLLARAVDLQISLWAADPPADPVIIAGSTGSRGTTARLMQAVLALPQGAVVLPGFDAETPPDVWQAMSDDAAGEDHPQYRFLRLCRATGWSPDSIRPWTDAAPPARDRNRVLSLALRPAPVTDQWLAKAPTLPDLRVGLQDVALLVAPSPRQEAAAIALLMRDAVARGETAALVTPNRHLTRQVQSALDRWRLVADDSAGRPLGLTAPGRFLRQILGLMGERPALDQLLALLKHPLCVSGTDRGQHLLWTRTLERRLRRFGPAFPTGEDLAPREKDATAEERAWAARIGRSLEATIGAASAPSLGDAVAALIDLAETWARGDAAKGSGALWDEAPGRAARAVLGALERAGRAAAPMSFGDARAVIETEIVRGEVREPVAAHPGLRILGTIEARSASADLVILAGLNEGSWPEAPPADPWLNRRMRAEAGLLLPERRIGLSAHDFQLAAAAPRVVLSRSRREAEAETVPSRWLNRLLNLVRGMPDQYGPEAIAEMEARGAHWLDLARALTAPVSDLSPAPRPKPVPPKPVRPKRLWVTEIETLIRDPYAIYARHVLGLRPLDPLRPAADGRERGNVFHQIVAEFIGGRRPDAALAAERDRLLQIADRVISETVPWPSVRIFWRASFVSAADRLLAFDAREGGVPQVIETSAVWPVPGTGFELAARPDRLDVMPDGRVLVIDYKTGLLPTEREQDSFKPQLALTALMVEGGAFTGLPHGVDRTAYIALKDTDPPEPRAFDETRRAGALSNLLRLIETYVDGSGGFTARRAVQKDTFEGDYDGLSRRGEWDDRSQPVPLPVGPSGDHA
jgi:ATP-dependent helicase/nuclease subunit B